MAEEWAVSKLLETRHMPWSVSSLGAWDTQVLTKHRRCLKKVKWQQRSSLALPRLHSGLRGAVGEWRPGQVLSWERREGPCDSTNNSSDLGQMM